MGAGGGGGAAAGYADSGGGWPSADADGEPLCPGAGGLLAGDRRACSFMLPGARAGGEGEHLGAGAQPGAAVPGRAAAGEPVGAAGVLLPEPGGAAPVVRPAPVRPALSAAHFVLPGQSGAAGGPPLAGVVL